MANLRAFTKFLRTGVVLVIGISLTFAVTSLQAHVIKAPDYYSYHYDFAFVAPDVVHLPKVETSEFVYPKNEAKPVNLHYQPVKAKQLNLIYSQRNI